MRFYHFKGGDQFDFDARIFAPTPDRASELFLVHLIMNGKIDYQMIWRELGIDQLEEPDRSQVRNALAIGVEGIAFRNPDGAWVPVPPFNHQQRDE
jgi:hypothetical protein